ncbi:MAG TPA: PQQ-binding-like beta-propeller repeat protein [Actinomycetota bacterium]|nr:PQQ-binding-like beta-propeller repeat protein [Actinomycetota bacterium]
MRRAAILAFLAAIVALPSTAPARDWPVAGGGDGHRTGYNPDEPPPYFAGSRVNQPNPEWVTKLSELPSGVFPMGGIIVAEGLVITPGASTNSIVALDQDTGIPVWRFQPDPRGSKFFPGDGYSGGYPATNAPWYENGVVYATFSNGLLYAIDADTGQKIWRWEVPAAGAPGEAKDHTLNPAIEWDFHNEQHRRFPLRPEVRPFTGDYPKFHSAVNFCQGEGKLTVMTLDSRVFMVDAATGTTLWHRYVGAPDWPGEFNWPEEPQGGITPASGRSTRRFEAQAGAGCLGDFVFVPTEDGYVKTFDNDTGLFLAAYDGFHAGDLGFAHDGGAGLADPRSGDLIINLLSNRMVRLSVPRMTPRWRRLEDAGTISICEERLHRDTCNVLITTQDGVQDGPIGGGVFGGNLGLDYQHRVIVNANQDGHLYIWKNIDAIGQHPTLVAAVPTGKNPYSKRNPPKNSLSFYLPDDGKHGPWVRRTAVLSAPALGGGVAYFNASWEHAIYGVQYLQGDRVLDRPRVVFRYEVQWDDTFPYPPFGETEPKPIVDIDLITWGSLALSDGHLYAQANDGSIYSFDLQQPTADTQRNLAILGSGLVPPIPTWEDPRGTFDRVWTTADWYKNQVPPEGWRLPAAGSLIPLGIPVALFGLWVRRRARRTPAVRAARSPRGTEEGGGYWWP